MLDGDFVGAVHPFEIYDPERVDYLYQTLCVLVKHHQEHGYPNFVINYVFEDAGSLNKLRKQLWKLDPVVYIFRLVCKPEEIEARIRKRSLQQGLDGQVLNWEIQRARELLKIQDAASLQGDLGDVIDTTHLDTQETAQRIWDMIHEKVYLVPYQAKWPQQFQVEKERLQKALGELAVAIHHIGSTAVPGLAAKPVIDIMLEIPALEDALACIGPLQELGYIFIDHPENVDRRFFRKGSPRSHHLHLVEQGSQALRNHLDFRDALCEDNSLREQYQLLKEALASSFSTNRKAYTDGKEEFILTAIQAYHSQP